MTRTVFLCALLISLLLAGCKPAVAPKPPVFTPPVPSGEWKIKMNHSGGIMGLSRSIEVASDGKFTVMDERAGKTITAELTENELSELNKQVMNFNFIPASRPSGMGCADCFIYDLKIQTSGKIFSIQLNDISLPNSGLESLVNYLRGLIDTALK
jgi:hypothetical protein